MDLQDIRADPFCSLYFCECRTDKNGDLGDGGIQSGKYFFCLFISHVPLALREKYKSRIRNTRLI